MFFTKERSQRMGFNSSPILFIRILTWRTYFRGRDPLETVRLPFPRPTVGTGDSDQRRGVEGLMWMRDRPF